MGKDFGNLKKKKDSWQIRFQHKVNNCLTQIQGFAENKTHVTKQCPSHHMESGKIESEIVKYEMIF